MGVQVAGMGPAACLAGLESHHAPLDPSFLLLQRSPLTYFRSGWHVVDFVSVVLLFTVAILWIDFVIRMANPFDIEIRQGRICCNVAACQWLPCF